MPFNIELRSGVVTLCALMIQPVPVWLSSPCFRLLIIVRLPVIVGFSFCVALPFRDFLGGSISWNLCCCLFLLPLFLLALGGDAGAQILARVVTVFFLTWTQYCRHLLITTIHPACVLLKLRRDAVGNGVSHTCSLCLCFQTLLHSFMLFLKL